MAAKHMPRWLQPPRIIGRFLANNLLRKGSQWEGQAYAYSMKFNYLHQRLPILALGTTRTGV